MGEDVDQDAITFNELDLESLNTEMCAALLGRTVCGGKYTTWGTGYQGGMKLAYETPSELNAGRMRR